MDTTYESWAKSLLRSVEDVIACDLGGFMCFWDSSEGIPDAFRIHSPVMVGVGEKNATQVFEGLKRAPPDWMRAVLASVPKLGQCILTSEVDPSGKLAYRSRLREDGVADGVNLIARDLNDRGFLISLAVTPRPRLTAALRRGLTMALTHILAAARLRARLAATSAAARRAAEPLDEPEAILSPEGRVMHALGTATLTSARHALERAARVIERARSGVDAPASGLLMWPALVKARWSLVDSFESDGKRYLVARENRPAVAAIARLTPTETTVVAYTARGLTTKETAYALGLSPSTVRVLLMRAARRCGFKNRRELVRAYEQRPVSEL
jgi:DNA-binding CsgD family transcriptional regulator